MRIDTGQNAMAITLNDLPLNPANKEYSNYLFGVEPYINGLVDFLRQTTTPMTVALQGEWGSGKTSLMYKLQEDLCNNRNGIYESVWINTWEYSFTANPQEALLGIIGRMVRATQVQGITNEKVKNLIGKFGMGLLKSGLGLVSNDTSALDSVEDWFSSSEDSTIGMLQEELRQNIEKKFQHTNRQGLIFFIDDLDRLNPALAVELLELLKNIFTLDKCIFVLAIDYDVVIKGLKVKFGDLTDKNEREFRSFFDKIIQVPFAMPVSNYDPKKFIVQSLESIGYISKEDAHDKKVVNTLRDITRMTVGNNPRSIKRLLNVLSLVKCIYKAKHRIGSSNFDMNHSVGQILNYAILAIQVQYPKIFKMLQIRPGFTEWNDEIVSKMNAKPISQEEKERLLRYEQSDEEWEQSLYAVCQSDPFLKARFRDISELFDVIRREIQRQLKKVERREDSMTGLSLESVMEELIQMSSVTSFSAGDDVQLEIDDDEWRETIYRYHDNLVAKIKDTHPDWSLKGRRVTKNGGLNFFSPVEYQLPFYKQFVEGKGIKLEYNLDYDMRVYPDASYPDYDWVMQVINAGYDSIQNAKRELDADFSEIIQDLDWIDWEGVEQYENRLKVTGKNPLIELPTLSFTFKRLDAINDPEKIDIMARLLTRIIEFDIEVCSILDFDKTQNGL